MISLIVALIAAELYNNIGVKVVYKNIPMNLFNAPPLITDREKIFYSAIVSICWFIAFIIAAAVPDYFDFVSIISASYSLLPLFAVNIIYRRIRIEKAKAKDSIRLRGMWQDTKLQRSAECAAF